VKFNFYYLTYVMQALIFITSVYSFHIGYYTGAFFGFFALGLSLIPLLVHRKLHIVIPWEVTFLIALTLFLSVGGYSYHWNMDLYPYYTKAARLIGSITVALLGFLGVLIVMQGSSCLQFTRWQIFFFIVIFTLAFGVVWEIWEFSVDTLTGLTPPFQQGNADTMFDLMIDLCAGMFIAILGTFYLKRQSTRHWADSFLEPGIEKIYARFLR
jgi:hypothetical protein